MLDFIKGLIGLVFKLFIIGLAVLAVGIAIIVFLLKKDVDEIKEFTEQLKRDGLKFNQ
ncbi:MAG TPA: hypothetical protein H9994_04225 [Candidatus Salinicoccus merdavium]|nr:hypothetical protein [Candidatus Salinicoccus merdavium]